MRTYTENQGPGRWPDVVDLTNEDESATYLLIQRGIALPEQRYPDAAREAFKEPCGYAPVQANFARGP